MKPFIYYSQNREDFILWAFFTDIKKGFYVDVGACDPIKYSVTKLFYENGWSGINIEPQDAPFKALIEDRNRDINLQIGIADEPGELNLRVYENESLSTFSEDIMTSYKEQKDRKNLKYVDKKVPVKTLKSVLTTHKVKDIQFLKVDVEGLEYLVLKSNDWKRFRPEVLCIEANNMVDAKKWRELLAGVDYRLVYFDGLNEYYVPKDSRRDERFLKEYQRLIVSSPSLIYDWKLRIDQIVQQLERVQAALDDTTELNNQLQEKVGQSSIKARISRRIRRYVKKS